MNRLRIALLAHSTNPRGGVVHALSLAEALCAQGHEAVVHAPDPTGQGFFRAASCPTVSVEAAPAAGPLLDRVRQRIDAYLRHFASPAACDFDVFHAHCGIGGNALATLRHRRLIHGFVRTVHHLDRFPDPLLADLQDRAVHEATRLLCVSAAWADRLAGEVGVRPAVVGNGVDPATFTPGPTAADEEVRARWGLGPGPLVLAVGGFERRKNTATTVEAFARLRADHPGAQLVVVGGASLLDHAPYRARCAAALEAAGLPVGPGGPVVETGPVEQEAMAALYRVADCLSFPSWTEGFGLAVLEAMASGTPTVVSRIPPFTEYLGPGDTVFVDPGEAEEVARGLAEALDPRRRESLRRAGRAVAAAHSWGACAERHGEAYAACARRVGPGAIHA